MIHPPDKPLDLGAFASPADLLEEVRARRFRVDQAILETHENYEAEYPDWKRGVLVRLLAEALEFLRDLCEEGDVDTVGYHSPEIEVLRPVEWDIQNDRIAAVRLSDDALHKPEVLLAAFVARCNVLALSEATGELAVAEHQGETTPSKMPDAVRALLEQMPDEVRNRLAEEAMRRPFQVGRLLDPVYLDPETGASIPSQEILRLEEALSAIPELTVPRTTAPDSPCVGVVFAVYPVVYRPWSNAEPRAYFPIQVSLNLGPDVPPLGEWDPEEREDWWNRLLEGLREVSIRLSGSQSYREPTSKPAPPPPERRSNMDPVPMPRQAAKDAGAYSLTRGLGPMFTGLRKIPNLDLDNEVACAEADRLFWEIAAAHLDGAVAAGRLSSWTKPTGSPGELVLHGTDERGARTRWREIHEATLKGKGGPGLKVAEPGFKLNSRYENGADIVETRVVLWPEEALGRPAGRAGAVPFRGRARIRRAPRAPRLEAVSGGRVGLDPARGGPRRLPHRWARGAPLSRGPRRHRENSEGRRGPLRAAPRGHLRESNPVSGRGRPRQPGPRGRDPARPRMGRQDLRL